MSENHDGRSGSSPVWEAGWSRFLRLVTAGSFVCAALLSAGSIATQLESVPADDTQGIRWSGPEDRLFLGWLASGIGLACIAFGWSLWASSLCGRSRWLRGSAWVSTALLLVSVACLVFQGV